MRNYAEDLGCMIKTGIAIALIVGIAAGAAIARAWR